MQSTVHSPAGLSKKNLHYRHEFDEPTARENRALETAVGNLLYSKALPARYRQYAEGVLLRCNTILVESRAASRYLVEVIRGLEKDGVAAHAQRVLVDVFDDANGFPEEDSDYGDISERGDADESESSEEDEYPSDIDLDSSDGGPHVAGRHALRTLVPLLDLERLDSLHVVLNDSASGVDEIMDLREDAAMAGTKRLAPVMKMLQDKIRASPSYRSRREGALFSSYFRVEIYVGYREDEEACDITATWQGLSNETLEALKRGEPEESVIESSMGSNFKPWGCFTLLGVYRVSRWAKLSIEEADTGAEWVGDDFSLRANSPPPSPRWASLFQ